MQVCDGLKGVDAGLRGSTPAFQSRRRESEARRRPPAAGPRVELARICFPCTSPACQPLDLSRSHRRTTGEGREKLFSLVDVVRLVSGKCAQHAANDVQTVITTHSEVYAYTSNSLAQASETPPWPTCEPPCSWSCASGAAASPRRIWQVRQRNKVMGKIKLFPTAEYSSKQPSDPVVPLSSSMYFLTGIQPSSILMDGLKI